MTPSEEVWLPVPGYEGHYEVSNLGRVRSLDRRVALKNGRYRAQRGRVLMASAGDPYRKVNLKVGGTQSVRSVHGLVAEAFSGPRPDGQEVRHLNGNPTDNRAANLAYGTHSQNICDAVQMGRHNNIAKTECPRGHAYSKENTRIYAGRRFCRQCDRERRKGTFDAA